MGYLLMIVVWDCTGLVMKGQSDQSGVNRYGDENGGERGWNSDSVGGGSEGGGRGDEIEGLEKGDHVEEKQVGFNSKSANELLGREIDQIGPDVIVDSSDDKDDEKFVGTREDLDTMLMLSIDQKLLDLPSTESSINLEDSAGPFSCALNALRARNSDCAAQQLIEWKPLEQHNSMIRTPIVPSLLDLSLIALSKNLEAIVSLRGVPDWLRHRFTTMLCNDWKMNNHVLNLLLKDTPTEIRVKDCSWITDAQACMVFGKLDTKNIRVLQLDFFGQCKTVIKSPGSLMCLRVISLRGAWLLSDDSLKALVTSAPLLESVDVGKSSLLTSEGIRFLAKSLAPSLRELFIDHCSKLDALYITKPVSKIQHLEVLSVAGNDSVSDTFVIYLTATNGRNMKELDLENCWRLTDRSLRAIGMNCPKLQSINISTAFKMGQFTDRALLYLANGCRSVRTLKCRDNCFSDDAIAAFLEASGESLNELSLNCVDEVGPSTALSLAKYSRNLSKLDLSWCPKISNEALGLVVDSCSSLKLLQISGCSQITEIFLKGHRNPLVQIVGENLTPLPRGGPSPSIKGVWGCRGKKK